MWRTGKQKEMRREKNEWAREGKKGPLITSLGLSLCPSSLYYLSSPLFRIKDTFIPPQQCLMMVTHGTSERNNISVGSIKACRSRSHRTRARHLEAPPVQEAKLSSATHITELT
ncbi:hypothetical protein JOQ06_004857 [Pogonophryne albipinna]|uniref:Uncharacterized protein n=1 Tax=Pogonophryne albipinna TaxID=1090488 RepID=A0AAD6FC08_9TELE|nr:hypothetical protein JOQ06_004857 [Pogonophryne albipinna]